MFLTRTSNALCLLIYNFPPMSLFLEKADSSQVMKEVVPEPHAPFLIDSVVETPLAHPDLPIPPSLSLDVHITKPVLFQTFTVSSSDTVDDFVESTNVWNAGFLAVYLLAPQFRFVRFDLEVLLIPNFPGMCLGAYHAYFEPQGYVSESFFNAHANPQNMWQCPGQLLDVSDAKAAKFVLPWNMPEDCLNNDNNVLAGATPWQFRVVCVAPMTSVMTSGLATGTVQIWVRPVNIKYYGEMVQSGYSDFFTSMSGVSDALARIAPSTGIFTRPAASGFAKLGSVLRYFGYTRQAAGEEPKLMTGRLAMIANCDIPDTSENVSLFASCAVALSGSAMSGEDITSNKFLYGKYARVFQSSLSSLTSFVRHVGISPSFCQSRVSSGGCFYDFPPGGYVGYPFAFWRGSMEYLIIVASSPAVKGHLQVVWVPSFTSAALGDVDVWSRTYSSTIIDLSGSTCTKIIVGYAGSEPSKANIAMNLATDFSVLDNESRNDCMNGYLVLRLVNAPLAPRGNIDSLVHVTVLARTGDDMEFYCPKVLDINHIGKTIPFGTDMQLQMADHQRVGENHTNVVVMSPVNTYPVTDFMAGEKFEGVRPMFQKFSPEWQISENAVGMVHDADYVLPTVQGCIGELDLSNIGPERSVPFTFQKWYMAMYLGVRGGTRYKIMCDLTGYPWVDEHLPQSGSLCSLIRMAPLNFGRFSMIERFSNGVFWYQNMGVTNIQQQDSCAEFNLPYYGRSPYVNARIRQDPFATTSVGINHRDRVFNLLQLKITTGSRLPVLTVYTAGSSDFDVFQFRWCPELFLSDIPT